MKKLFLLLSITTIFFSCEKESTPPQNNSSTGITINSKSQVKMTIDGVGYHHVNGQSSLFELPSGLRTQAIPPAVSSQSFGTVLINSLTFEEICGIELGVIDFVGISVDNSDFDNFMVTGNKTYTQNWKDGGVIIHWFDGNGVKWSTVNGSGDQTGSTINFTDFNLYDDNGTRFAKFSATFSCILYDGLGGSKTVTDGVYVGVFENWEE